MLRGPAPEQPPAAGNGVWLYPYQPISKRPPALNRRDKETILAVSTGGRGRGPRRAKLLQRSPVSGHSIEPPYRVAFPPAPWAVRASCMGSERVMTASPTDDHASAERRIQELTKELSQARGELAASQEQQLATAQILAAISSSPTDPRGAFERIAVSAGHLCEAYDATIHQVDGGFLRILAHNGPIPVAGTWPLMRGRVLTRAVIDRRTIHVANLQAETDEYPEGSEIARRLGYHTILGVPLIRAGVAIGVITVRRTEVRPFTDRQIELLKTFADQAVIAIENTRLFEAEQASKRELQESLEYQTAISEVLAVISRSPSDLKPVLEAIVETAARLCQADKANIRRKEGVGYRTVASIGFTQAQRDFIEQTAVQLDRSTIGGRVALDRETVHMADVFEDRDLRTDVLSAINFRTGLGVPLLRKGELVGLLLLAREKQQPFSRRQISLVETFADQAVIAIENTRLFEEVQAKTVELGESLEYQTATSDVLDVISRSPTDVQPVFDAIAQSAARLFAPCITAMIMREGDNVALRAWAGTTNAGLDYDALAKKLYPLPFDPDTNMASQAMSTCQVVQITDIEAPDVLQTARAVGRAIGFRSVTAAPLVKNGKGVGAITVTSPQAGFRLSDKQIALLKTLADQAVIAIENTRLFEAEQASKRELQESLEYQTAISDVLGVISRSPSNLQPVLDSIVETAARLCQADFADFRLLRDGLYHIAASTGGVALQVRILRDNPIAPGRDSVAGRVALERRTIHVPDIEIDPDHTYHRPNVPTLRSLLGVPLMRDGIAVGVIVLFNRSVRPFTQKQISLVTTFADQALIAIENARLFEEVQARTRELTESLEQQTATADVLKVISRSALDVQKVLDALVESAARLCNAYDAAIFQVVGESLRLVAHYGPIRIGPAGHTVPLVRGLIGGRAVIEQRTVQVADVLAEGDEYPESLKRAPQVGYRTVLAVPLVHAGEATGVIFIRRDEVRPFTERQIELINTFADQAVIAIENTRLFEEVQARTRELAKTVEDLEIASQHKNQFVANMSHELRTPLAAILGYAELIQEGFYEPQGPKSLDALTRIRANGKHLLGLINTVLDIAKIESGQFTLNMSEYAIESVVETVRAATESLAQNKKLTLTTSVAKSLPVGLGDEQRLTQVLLNLVGNAIKFTDTGEVSIAAGARNGRFAVLVTDTGPGIPLDHQDRIFEQFHQVDSSNTKAKGGTGLGLAIAKQIVEMHGGRIWVESTPGKGSTFQMELPARAQFHKKTP